MGDVRVLVVDDDFMVARIHERFVERTDGFVVVGSVRTGTEALDVVTTDPPDIVLLDVHLPDVGGLDVLRGIRAASSLIGVIMVTADRDADVVRSALLGGAQQYLVKPFEYPDLASRLDAVRRSMASLADVSSADGDGVDQATIDRVFGAGAPAAQLPKGLSVETGEALLAVLRTRDDVSAQEAGDEVGTSRVTARRYLEHFVGAGVATVRLRYGTAGRPERRYARGDRR